MSEGALDSDLAELGELARAAGRLALDTEFMGEGRYQTLLCLVQIAVPDGSSTRIAIADPLAEDVDFTPLAEVLADPEIEVVVHAGRQDIALLRRKLHTEVRNIFDTQVAAGFVGLAAQSSYDALLGGVLGVRLAKSASFTRWDTRALSPEQLAYAREDVAHLLELSSELQRRLRELGRLQWALQECQALELASDERDLKSIYNRLPRVRGMSASSQGVARELVRWRERIAAERDYPVQKILPDHALVEIAKRKPVSMAQLQQIRGLTQGTVSRRGAQLLDAVKRGLDDLHTAPEQRSRTTVPSASEAPLVSLCEALVRARALQAGLAYELIASRADLQAILTAKRDGSQADVRTLQGWRGELVGKELMDLLDGRLSLSVEDRSVSVRPG
ncbi:MAG: ribonuclease D [Solirubrobacteraceae bacterium]